MTSGYVVDPQAGEDELVERVRERAREARKLAHQWRDWAHNCRQRARVEHANGDLFGEKLLQARAEVREEAAKLLLSQAPAEAAAKMMEKVARSVVRTPPLIDYDADAVSYTIARSWQFCAHQIDPSLPEVQPRWDG